MLAQAIPKIVAANEWRKKELPVFLKEFISSRKTGILILCVCVCFNETLDLANSNFQVTGEVKE